VLFQYLIAFNVIILLPEICDEGYGALNQATRSSLESFGGDLDLAIQPFGLTPPGQLVTTSEAEETMLSGLSHHGGGGGHLQHEMLLVLKQQNYLKSLELSYKLRGLSMKEENLHLTSEQNTLMRENVDLSRNKAEFKEAEFQDRKLVLAYTDFTRRCADELVAGLCVMLCALFFGAWNYSYSRLVDVVSTCQPYLHVSKLKSQTQIFIAFSAFILTKVDMSY
jgi:hypothetical protein